MLFKIVDFSNLIYIIYTSDIYNLHDKNISFPNQEEIPKQVGGG